MIFQVRNHSHRGREAETRDQETEDAARRHEEGSTYTSAAADEEHSDEFSDEYKDDVSKNTAEEAKRGGIRDHGQNHPGTIFLD